MGRPKNTDERRAQIADGLVACMAERGYGATTIADIAAAAGLTQGLVHYHFKKGKQEVLLFVVERLSDHVYQRFFELAAKATARDDDPRARVHAFIDAFVGLDDRTDPRAVGCWIAIAAEAVRDPDVRAVYAAECKRAFDELLAAVAAAFKRARVDDDVGAFAAALWSAIQGSFQVAVASPGIIARGSMAGSLKRVVDATLSRRQAA